MGIDAIQFATQIAIMAVGAVATWAVTITRRCDKIKRDLDSAFHKIRELEKKNVE